MSGSRSVLGGFGALRHRLRSRRSRLPDLVGSPDGIEALTALIEAASNGQISPSEAAALGSLVATYVRIIDIAELEERREKIEKLFAKLHLGNRRE